MMKEQELPNGLQILIKIYEDTVIKKEPSCFSKLVSEFKGKLTKKQVAKEIDKYVDFGVIKTDNVKFGDEWKQSLVIGYSSNDIIRDLYKEIERPLPEYIDAKKVQCICEFATDCHHYEMGFCRIKIKEEEKKNKKRKIERRMKRW